jgi:hypothetical protein
VLVKKLILHSATKNRQCRQYLALENYDFLFLTNVTYFNNWKIGNSFALIIMVKNLKLSDIVCYKMCLRKFLSRCTFKQCNNLEIQYVTKEKKLNY